MNDDEWQCANDFCPKHRGLLDLVDSDVMYHVQAVANATASE
jgi:hypothetical protein